MNKRITVKFFGCLNVLKFRRHEDVKPNLVVKVSSSLCKTPQSPAVPASRCGSVTLRL